MRNRMCLVIDVRYQDSFGRLTILLNGYSPQHDEMLWVTVNRFCLGRFCHLLLETDDDKFSRVYYCNFNGNVQNPI